MKKTIQEISHFFGCNSDRKDLIMRADFDSRQVQPGSLFFALIGEKVDGHGFLDEVANRGALAAVVGEDYTGPSFGLELIRVPNVRNALQDLAREVFKEFNSLVIGITGTVGKTTTKEFVATLLAEKYSVAKTPGSMNSQVTLPINILNWEGKEEIFVMEMGMSYKGEMARLVNIVQPHYSVLTKISLAHAAHFKGIEEIAAEKCEIFSSKRLKKGFFPVDAKNYVEKVNAEKTWFDVNSLGNLMKPFEETHLLENFAAAVAVARHLGLSEEEISRGAQKIKPFDHRFQKIEKHGVLFVDDSYNASPVAAKAAFSNLPQSNGKRIALFGAMRELGKFEEESHRDVAAHALPLIDHLLCVGKECLPMVEVFEQGGKPVEHFADKAEAGKRLKELMANGDVVLIKGANSLKLWTILEEI